MTEWNPSVAKIEKVEIHPNADALDIAHIYGYPCIIKRNSYKEGDLVSYIPIDTVVDLTKECFSFLSKPRIKAMKIRGIYSQGLVLDCPEGFTEGQSLIDHFDLKKYVYPEEMSDLENLTSEEMKRYFFPKDYAKVKNQYKNANVESPPSWNPPHYDLESIRKNSKKFVDGETVVITDKLDGCNGFFRHDGERLWVKSRNFFKKRDEKDLWWDVAIRHDLENRLSNYSNYGFFGECYCHVSPFFYDAKKESDGKILPKFSVFDIFDIENRKFLDYNDMKAICNEIGLSMAPELYIGPWKEDKSLFALAEQDDPLAKNGTIKERTLIMEGFVIRPIKERSDYNGRVIFKLKSERYNLFK